MARSRFLSEYQVQKAKLENLQRLCTYLRIPEGSDMKRQSLINWLQWEGYVECRWPIGRMY